MQDYRCLSISYGPITIDFEFESAEECEAIKICLLELINTIKRPSMKGY
jgi:hypothetical protein